MVDETPQTINGNGSSHEHQISYGELVDRVKELELKLGVLSRLLPIQQARQRTPSSTTERCVSPPPPPPPDEELVEIDDDSSSVSLRKRRVSTTTPHLESPAPGIAKPAKRAFEFDNLIGKLDDDHSNNNSDNEQPQQSSKRKPLSPHPNDLKRNLSLTLLFEGDPALAKQNVEGQSMTAAERSWLSPRILQYNLQQQQPPNIKSKWLDYLNSFQESTPDVDTQMQEFIKVPVVLEGLMSFGFLITTDSYLYMITVLPIRFVWSCYLLCTKAVYKGLLRRQVPPRQFCFHRRHLYQLIQVLIVYLIFKNVLDAISIGKLYHWIRGQAMIKLYVIVAMVEIFDRLFSSLGQDCLESLYHNTCHNPGKFRFYISILVVLVYATCHTLILFVHLSTLNVAMNSADQALLSLLISGNFAEIKSTVFKKYNKAALFKITVSDICERFKLFLFLSLILLLNVCQGMEYSDFVGYLKICGLVYCAELTSDWIKHSFITKFNFLESKVYPQYSLLLAGDVTGLGHENLNIDHSHAVVKRIGFAQIPCIVVTMRFLKEALKYSEMPRRTVVMNGMVLWVALLVLKLFLGHLLQSVSKQKLYSAPEYSSTPFRKDKKKKQ